MDAWPILEYYRGHEPSATAVTRLITQDSGPQPIMSVINLAEICNAVTKYKGLSDSLFVVWLSEVATIDRPSSDLGILAGRIKTSYHMSLGDSFAVATAIQHDAVLWTGDAELLFEGCPWLTHDLRDDDLRSKHAKEIAEGRKKVSIRPAAMKSTFLTNPLQGPPNPNP